MNGEKSVLLSLEKLRAAVGPSPNSITRYAGTYDWAAALALIEIAEQLTKLNSSREL